VERTRQPLLVVAGELDREVPPAHADKLVALARARKNSGAVETVTIPGVNHLFVEAASGEPDEYASLSGKTVSPKLAEAVAAFFAPGKP
jgi:dipeptidyl aminopeptidase/acylaminoacyl peptidase